jgi:hypothetical protein
MFKSLAVISIAAMVLAAIILGPFFTVWAWNTLFGTLHAIPYTFETWCAVIILGVFIKANVTVKKNS